LYSDGITCTERLICKEWATIGALGDGVSVGEIPARHKSIRDGSIPIHIKAWNQNIFDAGLKAQNYDKGFERFVRKFNPEAELEATVVIDAGLTQGSRRCILLDLDVLVGVPAP
jgi:hypothetical protein